MKKREDSFRFFMSFLVFILFFLLLSPRSTDNLFAFDIRPEETFWKKDIAQPEEFLTNEQMTYLKGKIAPPTEQVVITVEMDPPIILRADRIESDRNDRLNSFVGNIHIMRGTELVTADRALWHDATNTAELSGNIKIVTDEFTIIAERAVVNMDLRMAKIYDGRAFFSQRNYYVSGEVIERLGERTLNIKDGTATTCDGPSPAWTIHADSLTVTEGGYATAKGVSFNTRYSPVMAVPYFMFPVKNERQSGLLFPALASSSRDGFTAALPLFWASGENHDFTLTPVWRNKRGLATTLEGRYHFENGKGLWQATYLKDRDSQRFFYNNDDKEETTHERYWLRAQNQWHFGEWDVNLNLDLASDPLYLAEFRDDLDGYNLSRNAFSRQFSYTVNEYLDPLRSNNFFVQRTSYDSFFRGGIEYTQDLYSKGNHDTIQRLPALQYNLVKKPLPQVFGREGLGLANLPRVSLDMRYDYFSRLSDSLSKTDETGHRFLLNPSLTWSSPVGGFANFELAADLGLGMYNINGYRPYDKNLVGAREQARHEKSKTALTGSVSAALSTTFSKVYGGQGDTTAIRHQLSPTVSFTYTGSRDDLGDLPYWDYRDRRLSQKTVRYGLLNTFVKKKPVYDEDSQTETYDYFQFLKVGLWSSYEFKDNMEWAVNPKARYHTTGYFDQGAGPIELEVEAFFNSYLSARVVSGFDGRTGSASSHDISLKIADKRGDSLTLAYDYDSPSTALGTRGYENYEELRADLSLIFNEDWSADFSSRYDLKHGKGLENHARIMYRSQCYAVGLIYSDSHNDRKIGIAIDLLGLGSLNADKQSLASAPQFFYH